MKQHFIGLHRHERLNANDVPCPWGGVSAPGIFFDPCPTGDLLGGALSAVRAQCNYLDG